MNAYSMPDVAVQLQRLEQMNTRIDQLLELLAAETELALRERWLAELTSLVQARGTVLDALLTWCSTPDGKRAYHECRDIFERTFTGDERRARKLEQLIDAAATALRQRRAQQALFIYQRGVE